MLVLRRFSPPSPTQVDGPPSFLDPEAIRPLAMSAAHMGGGLLIGGGGTSTGGEGKDNSRVPGKDFDISRLAPPLKGQKRCEHKQATRELCI